MILSSSGKNLDGDAMGDTNILSLYADAQATLARIEERRRLSPVRRPWKIRSFIAERQALAWIDATSVEASAFTVDGRGSISGATFDLTHWRQAVGAPVTLDTLRTDINGLLDWLGVHDVPANVGPWSPSGLPLADVRQHVARWQEEAAALPPSPPLLHGARLALAWRRHAPIGRGDAVASFLIGDRHGPGRWDASFGGLVALGFQVSAAAWKIADPAQFDRLWLRAIVLGASDHLDQETRLRGYADRAATHIASRRRPGRLKDVLMMAMSRPYISSRLVADQLGLTSAGAIKLLGIATDAGLLLERSGQSSYRTYAIPVSHAPHAVSAPDPLADPDSADFWSRD